MQRALIIGAIVLVAAIAAAPTYEDSWDAEDELLAMVHQDARPVTELMQSTKASPGSKAEMQEHEAEQSGVRKSLVHDKYVATRYQHQALNAFSRAKFAKAAADHASKSFEDCKANGGGVACAKFAAAMHACRDYAAKATAAGAQDEATEHADDKSAHDEHKTDKAKKHAVHQEEEDHVSTGHLKYEQKKRAADASKTQDRASEFTQNVHMADEDDQEAGKAADLCQKAADEAHITLEHVH